MGKQTSNMKNALLLLSIVGLALVCADLHTEDQYTEDANVMAVDDSTDEVDDSTDEMDDSTAPEASTLRETEHQEPQQKKKKNSEPTATRHRRIPAVTRRRRWFAVTQRRRAPEVGRRRRALVVT